MRWILATLGGAFVVVLILLASIDRQSQERSTSDWLVQSGMVAPVFHVVDAEGDSLSLADLKGKFVLLDFWFTTCPPCLDELPRLHALQSRYQDRLVVVGISIDRDRARFHRFLEREGIHWPQVLDMLDNEGAVQTLYRAPYYPSYWLINPDGEVALHGRHVLESMEASGLQYEYGS